MMHARRYRLIYVPQAMIRNGCPATLGEFVEVRRRNAAAHWMLRIRVATWGAGRLLLALAARGVAHCRVAYRGGSALPLGAQMPGDVRDVGRLVALVLMETLAPGPGVPDGVLAPDRHVRWRMARSARVVAWPDAGRAEAH